MLGNPQHGPMVGCLWLPFKNQLGNCNYPPKRDTPTSCAGGLRVPAPNTTFRLWMRLCLRVPFLGLFQRDAKQKTTYVSTFPQKRRTHVTQLCRFGLQPSVEQLAAAAIHAPWIPEPPQVSKHVPFTNVSEPGIWTANKAIYPLDKRSSGDMEISGDMGGTPLAPLPISNSQGASNGGILPYPTGSPSIPANRLS